MQKKVYLVLTQYFYTDMNGIEHQMATGESMLDIYSTLKSAKARVEWQKNYELEKGNAIEWNNSNEKQVIASYWSNNTKWRKRTSIIEKYVWNH